MVEREVNSEQYPEGGFIVETDIETLRKAAKKVLVNFNEFLLSRDGCVEPFEGRVEVGESLIFKEDIDLLPAEVIAINLGPNSWYVFTASEVPETGFPTTRDAMRVAESERKKTRILQQFLTDEEQAEVTLVEEWEPDRRVDAARILSIIKDVRHRFTRCE